MHCQRQVKIKNMEKYLKETMMLDYSNEKIQQLIKERKWNELDEFECIRDIYNFVRDEILFGYNIDDSLPASKVLADGFGQCNTKGTLGIMKKKCSRSSSFNRQLSFLVV